MLGEFSKNDLLCGAVLAQVVRLGLVVTFIIQYIFLWQGLQNSTYYAFVGIFK